MVYKKWPVWAKGAFDGIIVALLFTAFFYSNFTYNPGNLTCLSLTQCYGDTCKACFIVGLMFNLIYGFIIGGVIGLMCGAIFKNKNKKPVKNGKKRR